MGGRVIPITDAERERVRQMHAQGMTRGQIAEALGRSAGAISGIAKKLGLEFDRAPTRVAVEARKVDLRARRVALMEALIEDADRLRRELFGPHTIHGFGGGREFQHLAVDLPRPPAREQRDIATAMTQAINAALRLDERDAGGAEQAKSVLGALGAALGVAYEQMHQADGGQVPDA